MSIRATDNLKPPSPPALMRWPKAPAGFSKEEVTAWEEIGEAMLVLGSASKSDLLMAARTAQIRARVDDLLDDPELKTTVLASMLKLEAYLFGQLGLSPQARRQVSPLKSGKKEKSGFEEIE